MKRIMMSAAIALITVAFAASADETVLHVPFDSGLAAVESEGLEPLVFSGEVQWLSRTKAFRE